MVENNKNHEHTSEPMHLDSKKFQTPALEGMKVELSSAEQKKKDEEFRQKEQEAARQLETEKKRLRDELQDSLRKTITADFENQLKMLQLADADKEEKLKEARKKELA